MKKTLKNNIISHTRYCCTLYIKTCVQKHVPTHRTNVQDYALFVCVDVNLKHTVMCPEMCLEMCPELCINSNTQIQPEHLCRLHSPSTLQGITPNDIVHMSV